MVKFEDLKVGQTVRWRLCSKSETKESKILSLSKDKYPLSDRFPVEISLEIFDSGIISVKEILEVLP